MFEDKSRVTRQAVNEVAAEQLIMLLTELEEVVVDKDLQEQYEIDFLGDLYARMIVSVALGYYPSRMADNAEDAAYRLYETAKEHDDE